MSNHDMECVGRGQALSQVYGSAWQQDGVTREVGRDNELIAIFTVCSPLEPGPLRRYSLDNN